ncbi:MAG: FadD3 family acyl-CoA ligase [Deltaproteobacteria bacterium]|nr:FadD3 family acyl-CoA ligase [Deltaproteobacteria bacterium]
MARNGGEKGSAAAEDWASLTIPRALHRAARLWPQASALEAGALRLCFAELAAEAERATRAFMAAGVQRGDRVAIWAPNLPVWVVAALGLQSAGGVLVPLNTRFKAAEAAYVLRKSRARLLCTLGDFLGVNYAESLAGESLPHLEGVISLQGEAKGAEPWDGFLSGGATVPPQDARARAESVESGDLSDLLFTSGTTGNPKGVMTAHGQNLRVFDTWSRCVGLRAGDRYLIIPPFFHSFGYKAGWLACLLRGATALPQLVFDVPEVLERIGRERITVLPGPPTLYQSILAHPARAQANLSPLRLAVTGAAPTPVELIRRMKDELGFDTVLTAYGLTESCGTVSMCGQDDDAETIATTSGRALPDVEVRCVDADGREVARGEPGEVWVRGYNVMRGYFDDPEATAQAIDAEGWLHTGDIAVMDSRGYLRITDRIKDMFISGGFNVYPAEIESALFAHEEIAQAAVIGVPDERMGEVGMAFVAPVPGAAPRAEDISTWCRERMANYKAPRFVRIVESLPVNASGKVQKFVLRDWAREGAARGGA